MFVIFVVEDGALLVDVVAASVGDGAFVVNVWLERGNGSLGVPQWRGVKGALGVQWPPLGSVTMVKNIGSYSGTPASRTRGIASMGPRVR